MSGLIDTNVLVRYLIGDPKHLAAKAVAILDHVDDLLVTSVVLVETAHVLRSFYQTPRELVVDSLIGVVQKQNVVLELPRPLAVEALLLCRPSGRVSFADAFIWAAARVSRTRRLYTFDRRFPKVGIAVLDG